MSPDSVIVIAELVFFFFFFNDPATTEIYTNLNTLSLHDALPISSPWGTRTSSSFLKKTGQCSRSEEHTSELQSHSEISYAVFCLKKKNRHRNSWTPRFPYTTPRVWTLSWTWAAEASWTRVWWRRSCFFFLMIRRPPRSTLILTLFPSTTLFRSVYNSITFTLIRVASPRWKCTQLLL